MAGSTRHWLFARVSALPCTSRDAHARAAVECYGRVFAASRRVLCEPQRRAGTQAWVVRPESAPLTAWAPRTRAGRCRRGGGARRLERRAGACAPCLNGGCTPGLRERGPGRVFAEAACTDLSVERCSGSLRRRIPRIPRLWRRTTLNVGQAAGSCGGVGEAAARADSSTAVECLGESCAASHESGGASGGWVVFARRRRYAQLRR
ncbi:hypothetical protein B0H15DRAFT_610374 [Mycena belliarum]|uniref:Uncharacterized protein n=1 Tax=Mycena belliarum TaxID=1033014 RepID=A0AAD6XFM4_9AGAR|nr:hypothetical protein B0H15DRAFT_610374 [Mycena belliae]